MSDPKTVTALLIDFGQGDAEAMRHLLPLVYDELRMLAHRHRFRWNDSKAPGTTALVHEAYLKLVDQTQVDWENRAQFFHIASRAMRSILVDNARHYQRQKRGGGVPNLTLDEAFLASEERADELVALDEALTRLQARDERLGRIVECRFFGGLTIEETAQALSLSAASIKRGWVVARAWLYTELKHELDL